MVDSGNPVVPSVRSGRFSTVVRAGFGLVAIVLGVLASVYVWPTRFRYESSQSVLVRIDRTNGNADMLTGDGWEPMRSSSDNENQARLLNADELAKLDGTAGIESTGWLKFQVYNGNDFRIGDLVIGLIVIDPDGEFAMIRSYRLSSTEGWPLGSSEYVADLGFTLEKGQTFTWAISSAERR